MRNGKQTARKVTPFVPCLDKSRGNTVVFYREKDWAQKRQKLYEREKWLLVNRQLSFSQIRKMNVNRQELIQLGKTQKNSQNGTTHVIAPSLRVINACVVARRKCPP